MLGSFDKPNTLKCSLFDNNSWSAEATIAAGLGAIIKTSLAYDGNQVTYVFVLDDDCDLSIVDDQDLFLTTFDGTVWSAVTRLTNDQTQDTNPQLAYDQNGDLLLVWYKDGDFTMARNLDILNSQTVVEHGLSSGAADFRLAAGGNGQVSVIWPDSSPKGQDIYMAMYDPGLNVWGKGIMLTDTEGTERSVSAVQAADGDLALVYNRTETVMEARQVEVGGKLVEVDVPHPGTTDLCAAIIRIEGDLAISADDITITPDELAPGGPLTISANISNPGLKGAENIPVEFYYGDPAAGGTLIDSRQTIPGPIISGGAAGISVNWQVPETPEGDKDIYVVVDPNLSYGDRDRTNNVAHLSIFKPDIGIAQMYWQAVGPFKRAITISVKNTGTVPAEDIPLAIRKDGLSGDILHQEIIDSLAVNETKDVIYLWDTTSEQTSGEYLKAYAEVNSGQTIPETSYLNNTRRIRVPGPYLLCEGDFDGDGDVDGSDLSIFAADFGRTDCSGPDALPCEGDFDGDEVVDGSDLAVFASDFGRTDCPSFP